MENPSLNQYVLDLVARSGLQLSATDPLATTLLLGIILLVTWLSFKLVRYILSNQVTSLILSSKVAWDDALHQHGFFKRIAHLVPATTLQLLAPHLLHETEILMNIVMKSSMIYLILISVWAINSIFNTVEDVYNESPLAQRVPITGFVQVGKLLIAIIALLLVISQLLDKSPMLLLSGLGALTAIIILVFRDTILGFVAGINIVANRTVNTGDWIEMPNYRADGSVIAVGLTTVKVRNWDNTIATIPTYALMSDSIKNWRGMEESGGRRIKRAININVQTIKFCDADMLDRLSRLALLSPYLNQKRAEIEAENKNFVDPDDYLLNARKLTNIGTFRAYLQAYLKEHPQINQDMTVMVRQLPPTATGLPIEIYAFSKDKTWINYEGIQADIFDHVMAILPTFELLAYQRISDTTSKVSS
ncbi:MAG: mechanosensitive ion channel family protein [Aestuariibacter sp.]